MVKVFVFLLQDEETGKVIAAYDKKEYAHKMKPVIEKGLGIKLVFVKQIINLDVSLIISQ